MLRRCSALIVSDNRTINNGQLTRVAGEEVADDPAVINFIGSICNHAYERGFCSLWNNPSKGAAWVF